MRVYRFQGFTRDNLGTIILFFVSFFFFYPLWTDVIEIIVGMRHSPRHTDKNRSFRGNSRRRDKRKKHPRMGTWQRSD